MICGPRSAIVPAAGLGTRLLPATLAAPKELLPLGRYPALTHVLLEATGAAVEHLAVVVSPAKAAIRRWLDPGSWGVLAEEPALQDLRSLIRRIGIQVVEQPEQTGVLDAIARGRAVLPPGPRAVLYPDLVHLPDQRGLAALFAAYEQSGEATFGLYDASTRQTPHGPSVAVEQDPEGRIVRVTRQGPLRTTFGLVETPAYVAAVEDVGDPGYADALAALAVRGRLHGTILPGEVLDLGDSGGWLDAVQRFASGRAAFRDLPP